MVEQTISARAAAADLVSAYKRRNMRRVARVIGAAVVLFCLVVLDVITGPASLSFMRTLQVILDPTIATAKEQVIIWQLRLPVALMAVTVGAMLGVAVAEMQTILNTPLAAPFTLGLSSAASFGAALGVNLSLLRMSVLAGVSLLSAVAVSFVGAVAFVGLHDLNLAARFADPLFLLGLGQILAQGSSETVLRSKAISQTHGVDVEITTGPQEDLLVHAYAS